MPAQTFNDPPWHPMTDPVNIKHLGKLLEELGEATSAAARCLIQGIDGVHPETGKPNKDWLEDEIADVWANFNLNIERFGLDVARMARRCEQKMDLLRTWHAGA